MAVDFFFEPPTHAIPKLAELDFKWSEIPDRGVAEAIKTEEQYLSFHMFILGNASFTQEGELDAKPYVRKLDLSVRAGAIKATILICASIAEAALRSHAQKRGYRLHKDPMRRTFGNVLCAWKSSRGKPRPDVRHLWDDLQRMRDVRNNIHLFKVAANPNADFKQVLASEEALLDGARKVVEELAKLKS